MKDGNVLRGQQVPIRDTPSQEDGNLAVVVGLSKNETFWFYAGTHIETPTVRESAQFLDGEIVCEVRQRDSVSLRCISFGLGDVLVFDRRLIQFFGANTCNETTYRLRIVMADKPPSNGDSDVQLVAFQHRLAQAQE